MVNIEQRGWHWTAPQDGHHIPCGHLEDAIDGGLAGAANVWQDHLINNAFLRVFSYYRIH
jgi:hypothetical protein